jgi:hypothetical protein
VQTAVLEHGEEEGVLARGARDVDAQIGLGLGEVKDLGAVGEH